jgi:RNA polymerase sigma factor (sigma-70 family)
MAADRIAVVVHQIRELVGAAPEPGESDRELLHRFAGRHDQSAFESLVRRHGSMVLRLCSRLLPNTADAEDVFQATFLVLARKAASERWHDSVANWLYGVAHRLARKAKHTASRRAEHEGRTPIRFIPDPLAAITGRELLSILDEELLRLPDKYRAPLVLCYLEGLTRDEAAQQLGCPLGTLKSRLERGRDLLGRALTRRGVGLSSALSAVLAASGEGQGAVPLPLLQATLNGMGSGACPSQSVSALVEGASAPLGMKGKAMLALLLVGLVAAGAGVAAGQKVKQDSLIEATELGPDLHAVADQIPQAVDALDDPLPPGALMRLGTRRHRVQNSWLSVPDGRSYLVHQRLGDRDEIRRVDSQTGRVVETWQMPAKHHAVGISPDGRRVLMSTHFIFYTGLRVPGRKEEQEWVLTLYDLVQQKPVWTNRQMLEEKDWKRVDSACFSPDGRWIATTGQFVIGLHLWDAETGKEVWKKEGGGQPLEPIGFVANGAVLVVRGREDNTIFLVDRGKGTQQRSFPTMSQKEAHAGSLAPDGSAVLFGNYSPTIRVWDLATGKERPPLGGHKEWARRFAFAPDGKTLVTGGNDPFVLVRDWPSGKVLRTIELGRWAIERMAVSGDGRRLEVLFWGEQALQFYDLTTGKAIPAPLECHRASVQGVALAPEGTLLSYGRDATVRTWDLTTGKAVGRLPVEQDLNAGGFALSRDGRILATSNSGNNAVSMYERATGKLIRNLPEVGRVGNYLVLSPDGRWLAGADSSGGVIQAWEVATGNKVLQLKYNQVAYGVTCAFSPDGRQLATTEHGLVHFWDVATWKEQASLKAYAPLGLAFSPDGRTLATASVEGIRLFELATLGERVHIRPKGAWVYSLQFSSTGRWLAWVNHPRTIQVWDFHRGELLGPFLGHDAAVTGLAFSADEGKLASSSEDSTLLVWDVAGAAASMPPTKEGDINQAWQALAGKDARAAYEAIRVLGASPAAAVQHIRQQLKPIAPVDAQRINACLRNLDSDEFAVREQASRDLEQMGQSAVAMLERFLAGKPSLESRKRVEEVLASVSGPERLRQVRAVEVLERIGDNQARGMLKDLARGVPEATLTREAKATLERMSKRSGAE